MIWIRQSWKLQTSVFSFIHIIKIFICILYFSFPTAVLYVLTRWLTLKNDTRKLSFANLKKDIIFLILILTVNEFNCKPSIITALIIALIDFLVPKYFYMNLIHWRIIFFTRWMWRHSNLKFLVYNLLNLMGINRSPKQGLSRLILIDLKMAGWLHL